MFSVGDWKSHIVWSGIYDREYKRITKQEADRAKKRNKCVLTTVSQCKKKRTGKKKIKKKKHELQQEQHQAGNSKYPQRRYKIEMNLVQPTTKFPFRLPHSVCVKADLFPVDIHFLHSSRRFIVLSWCFDFQWDFVSRVYRKKVTVATKRGLQQPTLDRFLIQSSRRTSQTDE